VTKADRGKEFSFDVAFAKVPIARWTYTFAGDGEGTMVTERWEDLRPGWMATASGPVMGVRNRATHNEAGMRATLAKLKAAAE
jgi:hypothetical protein